MPFVKLDCGILNSSLWVSRVERDMFITALLLAEPREFSEPIPQLETRELKPTGWIAPAGWYGFVPAAGVGIARRALLDDTDAGLAALEKMGNPEPESRSQAFDGRRMIRIDGGYLILNYFKYRDRDYTAAERMRKLRARQAILAMKSVTPDVTPNDDVTRNVTQADSRVQSTESILENTKDQDTGQQAGRFMDWWVKYPKKVKKKESKRVWQAKKLDTQADDLILDIQDRLKDDDRWKRGFIPDPPTYLRGERWNDELYQGVQK